MAPNLIVATACATAALVPVLGPYTPLFAVIAGGLAATQGLPVRFKQLNGALLAMVKKEGGTERRGTGPVGRRQTDMDRWENMISEARRNAAKALEMIEGHLEECSTRFQELSNKVTPMAGWFEARTKRAEFWAKFWTTLAERITDKLFDRVITAAIFIILGALGIKFGPALKALLQP